MQNRPIPQPQNKTTFPDFGLSKWQVVKGDKEGDIKKMRRNYNILLLLFSTLTAVSILQLLKGGCVSRNIFKAAATKFESLKNDLNIPTVETCKSLNKNLKASLERHVNIDKAGNEVFSEISEKKATNNRFLLYGPPGTGKSFFAKIFAKSTNAEYIEFMMSDWVSKWRGETNANMKKNFDTVIKIAKKHPDKKYVVTFNEIDSIIISADYLLMRSSGAAFSKLEERSTFLNYLERLKEQAPNVTIIGTTNVSPKSAGIDRAALSRFQNLIEIPYPDKNCLYEALKVNISKMKNSEEFFSHHDIALKELAQKMEDRRFSFRNLEYITQEAQNMYLNDIINGGKKEFKMEYLQEAEKALKLADGELQKANTAFQVPAKAIIRNNNDTLNQIY